MNKELKIYIENAFKYAPKTKKAYELKEELLSNLNEKYNDLIESGYSENDAYNNVVAGMGEVDELISELYQPTSDNFELVQKERKKSALIISIAVMIYILCPIPVIFFLDAFGVENAGILVMFLFIATATGLLVYRGASAPQYVKNDDTVVEEFKEWKSKNSKEDNLKKSLLSAFWSIIVAVYLIISFAFGIWAYSWMIFIIGAAIEQIVKAYFEYKRS